MKKIFSNMLTSFITIAYLILITAIVYLTLLIIIACIDGNAQREHDKQVSKPLPGKAKSIATTNSRILVVLEDGTVWSKTEYGWIRIDK